MIRRTNQGDKIGMAVTTIEKVVIGFSHSLIPYLPTCGKETFDQNVPLHQALEETIKVYHSERTDTTKKKYQLAALWDWFKDLLD